MYVQAEKKKENRNRAVVKSLVQKKSNVKQGFEFFTNPHEVVAQRKLNESMNMGYNYLPSTNKSVIQMAKISKKNKKNKKVSYLKDLHKARDGKKPFKHKRSATAYGYFNKASKRRQGPHTISHIALALALEVAASRNRDLKDVLGSRLAPRPRQVVWLLNRAFKMKGAQAATKELRKKKTRYLTMYNKLYIAGKKGDRKAIEKLMELSPNQTYKWKEGSATAADMAGKGERRTSAADDIEKFNSMEKGDPIPDGTKTVDDGGLSSEESERVAGAARQLGELALSDDNLSEASYDSETDSEVSLYDDP